MTGRGAGRMFVLMLLAAKPGLVGVLRLSEQRHVKGRAGGDARDTNVVPKDLIASKIYYVIVKTTSSS